MGWRRHCVPQLLMEGSGTRQRSLLQETPLVCMDGLCPLFSIIPHPHVYAYRMLRLNIMVNMTSIHQCKRSN